MPYMITIPILIVLGLTYIHGNFLDVQDLNNDYSYEEIVKRQSVGGLDEYDNMEPLIREKQKRVMGFFRCYGWGPGCTGTGHRVRSRLTSSSSSGSNDGSQRHKTSHKTKASSSGQSSIRSGSHGVGNGGRRFRYKFQPFFTVSSGGWGPGKRSTNIYNPEDNDKHFNDLSLIDSSDLLSRGTQSQHKAFDWLLDDKTPKTSYLAKRSSILNAKYVTKLVLLQNILRDLLRQSPLVASLSKDDYTLPNWKHPTDEMTYDNKEHSTKLDPRSKTLMSLLLSSIQQK